MTFVRQSYKNRLRNIRQLIKITLTDTTKNLRMKCLVQLIDPNIKIEFFLVKLTTAYQTFCQKHLNY